jgi:AAA+ superfamily predicted ATPase
LLESIVAEWKKRETLQRRQLEPRSKLLFHGASGCGKSLTARALAHELGIPVYVVRFDAIIGAYLGQTAIHLRQLFHFAETTPCVLLLDELDALGKRRGNPLDVGELDRIVIALMQELEHARPQGLIVGTSNLPQHLDHALWRRFDVALAFKAPAKAALSSFAKRIAATLRIPLKRDVLKKAVSAKSFADAESIVVAEARRMVLLEE